jgi:two-component system phosphate regulon sensor histidine kinase PhoR
MLHSRIFWRLFSAYGILLVSALGALGIVLAGKVERHYQSRIKENLSVRASLLAELVRAWPVDRLPLLQERIAKLGSAVKTRITLLDRAGKVLADSDRDPATMENHADRPEVIAAVGHGSGSALRDSTTLGQPMIYVAIHAEPGSGPVDTVRVALPLTDVEEQLAGVGRIVWTAAGGTCLAAMALAFWLARRITRPLQELTGGAERIAAGDYGHTVYITGDDAVATLAQSFNTMSRRLANQFAQLEEDRQQLRMILSGMVEGVIALDADQNVVFANERAASLLGFVPQTAVGRKLWQVVRNRSLQDIVRKALSHAEPFQDELNWSGTAITSLTVYAAPLSGSPPRGAVLVLHDTSRLRRLERLRQEFVANVSHELKTPLSVIKACVETLLAGAAEDALHRGKFLERIAEQGDRLHALILDLLSLARLESETESFEFEKVKVDSVVNDCLERHRARAQAKNLLLEAVPPASPSLEAWADEEAVHQILDNLVDNAVKYTPSGGKIWVRWQGVDGHIQLEVEDNGIGIPEHDLPRIFERFYRVDKARSRELGGTGLGLSIVKHLVNAMDGSVSAVSRPGQGTRFLVQLPREPVS